MDQEILTFGSIKIEKKSFTAIKVLSYLKDSFPWVKGTIGTLLVTCIMMIKLNHYI